MNETTSVQVFHSLLPKIMIYWVSPRAHTSLSMMMKKSLCGGNKKVGKRERDRQRETLGRDHMLHSLTLTVTSQHSSAQGVQARPLSLLIEYSPALRSRVGPDLNSQNLTVNTTPSSLLRITLHSTSKHSHISDAVITTLAQCHQPVKLRDSHPRTKSGPIHAAGNLHLPRHSESSRIYITD